MIGENGTVIVYPGEQPQIAPPGYLQIRDYLVDSEFSAADIMMGYSLFLAQRVGAMDDEEFPNVTAYLARLRGRPAFLRAMD